VADRPAGSHSVVVTVMQISKRDENGLWIFGAMR